MQALAMKFGGRAGTTRSDGQSLRQSQTQSALVPRKRRAEALQSRLQEVLVFVLHKDGSREYRTMTVRALYNHVLEAITQRPNGGRRSSFDESTRHLIRKSVGIQGPRVLKSPVTLGALPEGGANSFPHDTNDSAAGSIEMAAPGASSPPPPPPHGATEIEEPDEEVGSPTMKHHGRRRRKGRGDKEVVTYRERLGGYLHPRDMRRLVTPFSSSNEPEIMVRRHVILLNCDPLRAIVLRDRLLVLVPDGADSILETLTKRISGGVTELENDVFGEFAEYSIHQTALGTSSHGKSRPAGKKESVATKDGGKRKKGTSTAKATTAGMGTKTDSTVSTGEETTDTEMESESHSDDEFEDMQGREWINMPFELQCLDAVLHTVSVMLAEEVVGLQEDAYLILDELIGTSKGIGHVGEDILRRLKNEVSEMQGRVQGFVRALNLILDEEEDLALMNLARLLTHPERFIQPVPLEVLNEESDEPELILEAYLQQGVSTTNQLDLLKGQVSTAEELIDMQLDAVRNRLLYINTLVSLLSLCVAIGSFVGSIFGMNLTNHIEDDPDAFRQVVISTVLGSFGVLLLLMFLFYQTGTLPTLRA
jgi:magnesium transporter